MKKDLGQFFSWSFYLIFVIAIIYFALSILHRIPSESNIQALQNRLTELGIPVKSISVIRQSPLEIEVILLSLGKDDKLGQQDLWNKFLTEREIELAYLNIGIHIDNYRMILVTGDGKAIYDSIVFLNPDMPSQKITPLPPSSLGVKEVSNILENNLDLEGLTLLRLEVPSSYVASYNNKLIMLELSTNTSVKEINISRINHFIMNIRPQIEKVNDLFGTQIVIIHVQIRDSGNELLVDYMEDLEIGRQLSWTEEIIDASWYPQPAHDSNPEPQETTLPVILPTATYPTLTSIPTLVPAPLAYPPPPTSIPYP